MKKLSYIFTVTLVFMLAMTGCSHSQAEYEQDSRTSAESQNSQTQNDRPTNSAETDRSTDSFVNSMEATELEVCFGDEENAFTLHLYNNETAAAIAHHVGSAEWRLPIYHYDDYDNWEVMQYYDIPSRYDIPSNPETITAEQAGEVYYSEPNRIVLFFGDAEVTGEYTKVGYFDNTEEFKSAVENNPVIPGWGNKIVLITSTD